MSVHVHCLTGCSPVPLAHYLKGLGILRLVAEQKDTSARGWWQDEAFHLATSLDQDALERFFLEDYAPTPLISPWNKGSGFVFAANNPALVLIEASNCARLSVFCQVIAEAHLQVAELRAADALVRKVKDESKQKGMSAGERKRLRDSADYKSRLAAANRRFSVIKEGFIPKCRRQWRGLHHHWMDAAVVLTADNQARFPALLGSGGNDGKNDFTKQYMESLGAVIDLQSGAALSTARDRLAGSLFRQSVVGANIERLPVGQFIPVGAGGANMTNAPDSDSAGNPWDYIFLLEGTLMLLSSATRKLNVRSSSALSAPFATRSTAAGFGSASSHEGDARGEQWMPLWDHPATVAELHGLMAEGRAQLGCAQAIRPTDFVRSVARLGVARGVAEFQRFGYLERNGKSNLAVPLGRWQVASQPHQDSLDDLDHHGWMGSLRRATGGKHPPAGLVALFRQLEGALMAVCSAGQDASRWQSVLLCLAGCEQHMVQSGKFTAEQRLLPIPPLSGGWIRAADDGSPEFRLAVALALQTACEQVPDTVRRHWLPLDEGGRRFATDASGLRRDPRVVGTGADAERDMVALVQRRLIEGSRNSGSRLPLTGMVGHEASLADVMAFVAGDLVLRKLGGLARAFMALDRRHDLPKLTAPATAARIEIHPLYALFRLACLPWPLPRAGGKVPIPCDPAIVNRLASGDLPAAGDIAIRRLRASGLVPVIRHVAGDAALARRLAASLALPISARTAAILAERLTKCGVENKPKEGSAA